MTEVLQSQSAPEGYIFKPTYSETALDFVSSCLFKARQTMSDKRSFVKDQKQSFQEAASLLGKENFLARLRQVNANYHQYAALVDSSDEKDITRESLGYLVYIAKAQGLKIASKKGTALVETSEALFRAALSEDYKLFLALQSKLRMGGRAELDQAGVLRKALPSFVYEGEETEVRLPRYAGWEMNLIVKEGTTFSGNTQKLHSFFVADLGPKLTGRAASSINVENYFIR